MTPAMTDKTDVFLAIKHKNMLQTFRNPRK